jgi:hypothetical protein
MFLLAHIWYVRASQAAEKLVRCRLKRQGTTSQAPEKLKTEFALYQGTTSVVPRMQQKNCWALAPAGCFSGLSQGIRPFSAAFPYDNRKSPNPEGAWGFSPRERAPNARPSGPDISPSTSLWKPTHAAQRARILALALPKPRDQEHGGLIHDEEQRQCLP